MTGVSKGIRFQMTPLPTVLGPSHFADHLLLLFACAGQFSKAKWVFVRASSRSGGHTLVGGHWAGSRRISTLPGGSPNIFPALDGRGHALRRTSDASHCLH